jgi:hypothetical protein
LRSCHSQQIRQFQPEIWAIRDLLRGKVHYYVNPLAIQINVSIVRKYENQASDCSKSVLASI